MNLNFDVFKMQASSSHKLPSLYLVDSIIKNVPDSNYLEMFTKNIVVMFVSTFEKVSNLN